MPFGAANLPAMWLGIDFGTSNSSAARLVGGHPHAVREPISQQPFFPSCVLLVPPNGATEVAARLLTGVGAERRMRIFPDRFRAELKRNLGEPWPLLLGGEEVAVVDAIGAVMRALKTEADRMSGGPFSSAMLSVPVAFGAERVGLIEAAARSAGFEDVKTCLEPEAAARYHLHVVDDEAGADTGELLLVYDFGGGTFDVSLVRKQGAEFAILASAGIEDCGGRDLDQELYAAIAERVSPQLRERLTQSVAVTGDLDEGEAQARLRLRLTALERCRRVKHELSVSDWSETDLGDPPEIVRVDRAEFEKLVAPHLERTLDCCAALVRGQSADWKDVSRVLMVGGTTRIPYIARMLRERFERPVFSVEDPELAVAFGASLAIGASAAPRNGGASAAPAPTDSVANISLQALIDAAAEGSTITIAPGIYLEPLHVDKALSLVSGATATGGRVVIQAERKPALTVKAKGVRLTGLGFHAVESDAVIRIEEGEVEIDACDLWGGKEACIAARGDAKLVLRGSRIHDGLKNGVRFEAAAGGRIENNDIAANKNAGISIASSGKIEVENNRLSRNAIAIQIAEGDENVVVSRNDAFENAFGMDVAGNRSSPLARENRLHDNTSAGLKATKSSATARLASSCKVSAHR
jgi:parallel beta-helix repeat protein